MAVLLATIFNILSVLCLFFLYYFSTKQRHMDRVVHGKSDIGTMDQTPQATLDYILVDWTNSDGSWVVVVRNHGCMVAVV
jgi:uncharacterized membrane protein YecN with MAPEG domain